MPKASSKIKKLIDEATAIAMLEIEVMARKIMEKNPTLTGFCMAMGSASFYETAEETEEECAKTDDPCRDDDPRLTKFYDFLYEWNDELKLTGIPFRLDSASGPVITDW